MSQFALLNLSRHDLGDHGSAGVCVGGRFSPLGPRGISAILVNQRSYQT
jgi:hypothetical protein